MSKTSDRFDVVARDAAGVQTHATAADSLDAAIKIGLAYRREGCAVIIREHNTKEYSLDDEGQLLPMP